MHKKPVFISTSIIIFVSLVLTSLTSQAKEIIEDLPRSSTSLAEFYDLNPYLHKSQNPQLNPKGLWNNTIQTATARQVESANLGNATGGPDEFGYTWDNSVSEAWIDASDGIDAGLSAENDHTASIPIPFPFKFYENIYSSLYISLYGFMSFDNHELEGSSQSELPSAQPPNAIIATNWMPFEAIGGYVKYKDGGAEPNRWFVVEWNNVKETDADNYFTFEVILFENGDIVFNYRDMPYTDLCKSSGIEDPVGLDGLAVTGLCDDILPEHSVRIYRPAPSARVKISPRAQGRFTNPGSQQVFQIHIKNAGDFGRDTFDLSVESAWSYALFCEDGSTPLSDTDSDGNLDTGILDPGENTTIVVKIQTPYMGNLGDFGTALITIRSSIDLNISKMTTIDLTIPGPFAQVYTDYSDGAMRLQLSQPYQQKEIKVTPDNHSGRNHAIVAAPNGNLIYLWSTESQTSLNPEISVREIHFVILDHHGNTVTPVNKIVDHSSETISTYDYNPTAAVNPDGLIGITWTRQLVNNSNEANNNVYFAVLDSFGNLTGEPINLTNNELWENNGGKPKYYYAGIEPVSHDRFVLAWVANTGKSSDIYYTILNADQTIYLGNTQLITDWSEPLLVHGLSLSQLDDDEIFFAWSYGTKIVAAILDDTGSNIIVSNDFHDMGEYWGSNLDSVMLPNRQIFLAWSTSSLENENRIAYSILTRGTLHQYIPSKVLNNPKSASGDDYVSVTADPNGHTMLTWMEYDYSARYQLYYALVEKKGAIITEPVIFFSDLTPDKTTFTSFSGHGNTTYMQIIGSQKLYLPVVVKNLPLITNEDSESLAYEQFN